MYTLNTYLIRCLSNLHAGSGKNDYGAIDNLIQRDSATGFPCINDSSLKGAMREYFNHKLMPNPIPDPIPNFPIIDFCFGVESDTNRDSETGKYLFQQAHLLSIPVRSNTRPYFLVTCPLILRETADRLNFFDSGQADLIAALNQLENDFTATGNSALCTGSFEADSCLEEEEYLINGRIMISSKTAEIKNLFGNNNDFVIVDDCSFATLVDNMHLPVIARNKLLNGISQNLWYEQLLPRESRLMTFVLIPTHDTTYESGFNKLVHNKRIQIGANASVGFGQCFFNKLF